MNSSLIHADGKILAAIDASVYADSVAAHAAWAASRVGAPLQLLHTIERASAARGADLSGNLAADDREALLLKLTELDEQRGKLAQQHGQLLLQEQQAKVREQHGVEADLLQRHGELVDSLLELESGVRIFVIGKRGEHADFARGHLGGNLERVVRAVHRPVLIAARAFRPIQRVMIAFDGSATTRKCIDMVCASPLATGMRVDVLMVGSDTPEHHQQLEWAKQQLQQAGFKPDMLRLEGRVEDVIREQVSQRSVDLLVMGAYGHSRIRSLILGSTTTQLLRSCQIPLLLLR